MKARFLWATAIVLVLLSLPALVLAQPPIVPSAGPAGGGGEGAPLGSPDALWDQPSDGYSGIASQYFPDRGFAFYSADDFSNAEPWNIESIFVDGMEPQLSNADTLHWLIYPDAGGVPAGHPDIGGELWSYSCKPSDPEVTISGSNDQATLDIVKAQGTPLYLPPGTYWFCFYPSLNYALYWQWFWDTAGTTNLATAQFIDPTDFFGVGLTSWTPWPYMLSGTYDAAFRLEGSIVPPPPPPTPSDLKYLHCTRGLFNLTDPLGTQWHELWPIFCREYHLSSWEDNGDGILSYCDTINMYDKPDGEPRDYHVEDVTITLVVAPPRNHAADELFLPLESPLEGAPNAMYIELEGGYNATALGKPIGTLWHEVYPNFCRTYNITGWMDNDSQTLDWCDGILLERDDCPLDEDFSGSWLPSGWTTDDWIQSNSNYAGGTPPEAQLHWANITGDYAYLDSKPVDTTGACNLTLEFKSFIDDYCCEDGDWNCGYDCGCYDCRVYTRAHAGDSWTDVTPWSNPIYGSVGPGTYSVDISSDIGSSTQVRFEFDGFFYALDDWYLDDVKICSAGSCWWHVEAVAVDIVVTPEPPPVGGEAYPVSKASLLAPWIATGVAVIGGAGAFILRRRRA